jgi:hypothetical protein
MKYQVGDLIDEKSAGLGYVSNTTDRIFIVWFSDQAEYGYTEYSVNSWLINKNAIHYPVGNQ